MSVTLPVDVVVAGRGPLLRLGTPEACDGAVEGTTVMGDLFSPDFSASAESGLPMPSPPPAPQLLFDVRSTVEGLTAVIRVEGDVDLGSAGQLERSVISAVEAGASNLVLDLGRVSFLDCTGLRVLLNARQLAGSRGGLLRLDSVPARVRRVLLLTGAGVLLEPGPDTWPTVR